HLPRDAEPFPVNRGVLIGAVEPGQLIVVKNTVQRFQSPRLGKHREEGVRNDHEVRALASADLRLQRVLVVRPGDLLLLQRGLRVLLLIPLDRRPDRLTASRLQPLPVRDGQRAALLSRRSVITSSACGHEQRRCERENQDAVPVHHVRVLSVRSDDRSPANEQQFVHRYWALKPPSTTSVDPNAKLDLSEARYTTASAISSGCASRPMAWRCSIAARIAAGSVAPSVTRPIQGVSTVPGATALARMPAAA